MKVLIVTGKLASSAVRKVSDNSKQDTHVYVVDTPIAAFLTPKRIIKEIKNLENPDINSFDMIITPGLIRKDVSEIEDETGIPTYKGSTSAADLNIVLDMVDKLELSSKKPADRLIEEELRKRALKFIEDFEKDEKNTKKLLKKSENILVGNLPVGEDFPMRVLAEMANAPLLSKEELLKRAQYFVKSGAQMIDIGMIAGETLDHKIPEMVKTLKENLNGVPVSIDTINPVEIKAAVESGVDMVLSLDLGNCDEILPLMEEKKVPAVILPTNFAKNWTPKTVEERVNALEELMTKCKGINVIADLILDPINSQSMVESIIACHEFKKRNKKPLFFGVGNVTELLDTDSVGVNSLLSGIAMELGASILFTPEESGKTIGSVHELAVSSKMMFLAKNRGSIPKDLGINLIILKDKRKGDLINEEIEVPVLKGLEDYKFSQDPQGSFKIIAKDGAIKAVHYIKMKPDVIIEGETAKAVYDEIIKRNLISRLEHATYLGSELQKAEIAIKLNKNYVQDFPLFKKLNY
ncbi:MAG: dihydropteroate synthase-like protein [Methanobacterium sp.]|uniref:dihydropteroate synthase-like protein n=1 Tax=Methanobacterium sp. TaxID=2164 RepID=UPI003D661F49|nr:dihydropteroate synthase-like protein [Methanobacterium sp.]